MLYENPTKKKGCCLMMKSIAILLGAVVFCIIAYFVAARIFRKQIRRMSEALYIQRDAQEFYRIVKQPMTKLFLSKREELLLTIDAAILEEDEELLLDCFQTLNKMKLSPGQQLKLVQHEMVYYSAKKDKEQLLTALERFQKSCGEIEDIGIKAVLTEGEWMYHVDMEHDVAYLPRLLEIKPNDKLPAATGILYYRIGMLYHYDGKADRCKAYMKKAAALLQDPQRKQKAEQLLRGKQVEDL